MNTEFGTRIPEAAVPNDIACLPFSELRATGEDYGLYKQQMVVPRDNA